MSAAPKGIGLLKRGWNEIPDVIGSTFLAAFGLVIGIGGLYYYNSIDGNNRRYREEYTVIRHDDPKAGKVRKD